MSRKERTPEEAAQAKRTNAVVMMAAGAVMAACGLAGGLIVLSGRGDAPDWMFGSAARTRASGGTWTVFSPRVSFEDWGEEAFARAARERKLVLLFLGPSYNAPTARLDTELFSDPGIAALVEADFVPVRVKSEERPDLDRRYRAGGWPTTAVLLSDGVVLDAGVPSSAKAFARWAQELAERAASHPEAVARARDAAAAARRDAAAARSRGTTPPSAAEADRTAESALLPAWDPARRTFDARGPRFPRFERVVALERLSSPWAKALTPEAAKGLVTFQDPADGGFRRLLDANGGPAALEKVAADQAGALDALCGPAPESARRLLGFLERDFTPEPAKPGWRGWLAGWALDAKLGHASDGADFARFEASGMREVGAARVGDDAELGRAVLECAVSTQAQKARARRAILAADAEFARRRRVKEPGLLLDDAAPLGDALLAAGETSRALEVFHWMEDALGAGPSYLDGLGTGVLPPELARAPDPALDARALRFVRRLAAALPPGADKSAAAKRAEALFFWLSARPGSLDPAVWAALAADEPR
jgi:hypothetical protein